MILLVEEMKLRQESKKSNRNVVFLCSFFIVRYKRK